ncbi:MAG: tRNA-dihydrouridine synthase family protein [Phycisphaeraceae bacterium]|nr:tRNA-dihydrouridine synthase family protein [Phycisphaeraceae bacterium]
MASIGNLTLDAPFFQAGLAGYSDAAMRLVARRHGCPYCVTEAMLDVFLINGGKGLKEVELDPEDHPIAGQLMGSHPKEIAQAAKILVNLGYDVIDVNIACPVKKVRRRSRGGHLLCRPDDAVAVLEAVREAVPSEVPATVKLRRGTDDSAEAERDFHKIFQKVMELGYAAATVHPRSVEQKYLGPSRWEFLRELVKQYVPRRTVPAIPCGATDAGPIVPGGADAFQIFGSGDIFAVEDIFRMIAETGVAAVSVARGCIGNPWIFAQARALANGDREGAGRGPSIAQQRQVLLEHFELSCRLHGERKASMTMRKFGIKFSRHHPESEAVAKAFIAVHNSSQWRAVVDEFYGGAEMNVANQRLG